MVGGAGSLYTNKEHTAVVSDGPDFPPQFLPLAKAQGKALEELRGRSDVKWTFISPAGDFQAEGERTGKYILVGGADPEQPRREHHQLRRLRQRHGGRDHRRRSYPAAHLRGAGLSASMVSLR